MGGVGLWVVEVLVCLVVGYLILIDVDDICVFNINWQLLVMEGNYGCNKVEVMVECCCVINLGIDVDVVQVFLMMFNMVELLDRGFDLVIDVCDSFWVKVEMIVWCCCCKLLLLIVGVVGGCIDLILVCICDVLCIEYDVMLVLICKKLCSEFNFLKNVKCYFGVLVVYLLENVKYLQVDGSVCGICLNQGVDVVLKLDCGVGLGVVIYIIGVFVFVVVGKVLEMLLELKKVKIEVIEVYVDV